MDTEAVLGITILILGCLVTFLIGLVIGGLVW